MILSASTHQGTIYSYFITIRSTSGIDIFVHRVYSLLIKEKKKKLRTIGFNGRFRALSGGWVLTIPLREKWGTRAGRLSVESVDYANGSLKLLMIRSWDSADERRAIKASGRWFFFLLVNFGRVSILDLRRCATEELSKCLIWLKWLRAHRFPLTRIMRKVRVNMRNVRNVLKIPLFVKILHI